MSLQHPDPEKSGEPGTAQPAAICVAIHENIRFETILNATGGKRLFSKHFDPRDVCLTFWPALVAILKVSWDPDEAALQAALELLDERHGCILFGNKVLIQQEAHSLRLAIVCLHAMTPATSCRSL